MNLPSESPTAIPLSGFCEALATGLAARSLSLDPAGAELAAIAVMRALVGSHGPAVLVVTGSAAEPRHTEALAGLVEVKPGDTPSYEEHGPFTAAAGAESGGWQAIRPVLRDATAEFVLTLAVALSVEEIASLNHEVLADADLSAVTLLGDAASADLRPSPFTRSWAIWVGELPEGLLTRISNTFRKALGLPESMDVESLEPLLARVEVVSLRTAAMATSGLYGQEPLADPVFDLHARIYKEAPRSLDFAALAEAIVVPSASWKVLVDGRLYVEEIGYVESGRPHLIESWPEFGASWSIRTSGPACRILPSSQFTILLGGDVAHYHLLLNWLPRLRVIDDPQIARLVGDVPKIAVSSRFSAKETGLIERLIGRNVEFVFVPEVGTYRFSNLIVPGFFSHHEFSPGIADWYRAKLGIGSVTRPRRIYISRADSRTAGTPRRKVVNEAEVIAALSAYGFEAVTLSGVSIDDQIALFRDVEFVIAPHGAGLANMVFAPRGAAAIVLENSWAHHFIADMLNVAGHRASILVCQDEYSDAYEAELRALGYPDTEIQRSRDMVVDCTELDRLVGGLL